MKKMTQRQKANMWGWVAVGPFLAFWLLNAVSCDVAAKRAGAPHHLDYSAEPLATLGNR